MAEQHMVVWCDSVQGLISTRVDEYDIPVTHDPELLPESITKVDSEAQLYDILSKRDGRKVSFPASLAYDYLAWDFSGEFHQV